MNRWSGLIVTLGLLAAVALFAAPAGAQPPPQTSAVKDFGACLAGQQHGDLLVLLDESGSLGTSDPGAARVAAAKSMLDKLAFWTRQQSVQLDVAVAGFADGFDLRHDWVTLGDSSLPSLGAAIDGEADRHNGNDTDYGNALTSSLDTIVKHRADAGAATCRAIAWFTDGKLDFQARGGGKTASGLPLDSQQDVDAAISATRDAVCRGSGVADQLRSVGIRTFAVGLLSTDATASDFNLLREIATGETVNGEQCGSKTTPRPGEFYPAQNIGELLDRFDEVGRVTDPVVTERCVSEQVREECKHKFVLDNSVRAVRVEADAGADGLTPVLVAPDGTQTALAGSRDATVQLAGVPVDYRWTSEHQLEFTMENAAGAPWRGAWALAFTNAPPDKADNTKSKSSITVFGNLRPEWLAREGRTLHSDEQTTVDFGIVDHDGKPVDATAIEGTVAASMSLTDSAGNDHPLLTGLGKEELGQPSRIDLAGVPAGAATMHLTLAVTTAAAGSEPGTKLGDQLRDLPLTVAPPAGFPEVPSEINLGTLEGSGEFGTDLRVGGEGCVWLDPTRRPANFTGSPEIGAVTVGSATATSAGECPAGTAAKSIPLVVKVDHDMNGVVTGTLPVLAARAGEVDNPQVIDVKFTALLEKPRIDGWPIVLAGVALLGLLLPVLMLYLAKWFTSRIPAGILKPRILDVQVSGGQVLQNGAPVRIDPADFVDSVRGLDRARRRVDIGEGIALQAHSGWSPFGSGYVTAVRGSAIGASNQTPATEKRSRRPRLPLVVKNTWFVLYDAIGDRTTLVLLRGSDPSPHLVHQLADDALRRVPEIVEQLRAAQRSRAVDDPPPPSDSPDDPFGRAADSAQFGDTDPFGNAPSGGYSDGFGRHLPAPDSPDPFGR